MRKYILILMLLLFTPAYAVTTLQDALNTKTNLTESIRILSVTNGINSKTVATTNLYTVPAGKTAIIYGAIVRATNSTAITVGPTIGIGVAAGEDDLFYPVSITVMTNTNSIFSFGALGVFQVVPAGSVIKAGIDVGATGTSQTMQIFIIGFLI